MLEQSTERVTCLRSRGAEKGREGVTNDGKGKVSLETRIEAQQRQEGKDVPP